MNSKLSLVVLAATQMVEANLSSIGQETIVSTNATTTTPVVEIPGSTAFNWRKKSKECDCDCDCDCDSDVEPLDNGCLCYEYDDGFVWFVPTDKNGKCSGSSKPVITDYMKIIEWIERADAQTIRPGAPYWWNLFKYHEDDDPDYLDATSFSPLCMDIDTGAVTEATATLLENLDDTVANVFECSSDSKIIYNARYYYEHYLTWCNFVNLEKTCCI